MPGARDKNLRSGDLAENLGLLLLQGLATLAPVPRTEDVGVDVVATLLRECNRRLIAEDSFFVQLKSSSVRSLVYRGPEVEWFLNLELPVFIGSVNLAQGEIELFACHRASVIVAENINAEVVPEIRLDLDKCRESVNGVRSVQIGPPALKWSLSKIAEPEFRSTAYEILKQHIAKMKANATTRSAGVLRQVRWETNCLPKDGGLEMMAGGVTGRFPQTLSAAWPYLLALHFELIMKNETSGVHLAAIAREMVRISLQTVDPAKLGITDLTLSLTLLEAEINAIRAAQAV